MKLVISGVKQSKMPCPANSILMASGKAHFLRIEGFSKLCADSLGTCELFPLEDDPAMPYYPN